MSEREEYAPSMDHVRNMYARIMKPDGTVALAIRRQKEFDRALAAHDRALREQVARDILDVAGDWDTILDAFAENTTWETTGTEMTRRIITAMAAIARGEGSE